MCQRVLPSIVRTHPRASVNDQARLWGPDNARAASARTTLGQYCSVGCPALGLPPICSPHSSESVIQGREIFPLTDCA